MFYTTYQAKHNPRSPYTRAWRMILSSSDSFQSTYLDCLNDLFGDRSNLILFDFPELLSAYLGISGRTFGSVLAQTPRSSIDLVDASGRTTLSWAAGKGDLDAVKKLLNCGADPNYADKYGLTPLHWCANAYNHDCVTLLLAANADVDKKDSFGRSALSIALRESGRDDPDLVEILLSNGADIESVDDYGSTPLHCAVSYNAANCLSLLLRRGVNINALNSDGQTALQLGINANCHQTVEILLDHGGNDLDNKNNSGRTILHYAALYGDVNTIAVLRSANLGEIDITATDNWGDSALDYAMWRLQHNEEWSNWALRATDEDPLQWFSAFRELWDGIIERQKSAYGEEGGVNHEREDEEWEDEEWEDEEWEDEEQEDDEREDDERENWQDAPESANASSE